MHYLCQRDEGRALPERFQKGRIILLGPLLSSVSHYHSHRLSLSLSQSVEWKEPASAELVDDSVRELPRSSRCKLLLAETEEGLRKSAVVSCYQVTASKTD
jgi:hypothetical protein